mmetsp:Transcript_77793/g.168258  ORF Transcript_77793/g.168258 Transcript_77793/m.168258 type:complete len:96 (+) Transcript_77793:1937-2224(+)
MTDLKNQMMIQTIVFCFMNVTEMLTPLVKMWLKNWLIGHKNDKSNDNDSTVTNESLSDESVLELDFGGREELLNPTQDYLEIVIQLGLIFTFGVA